MAAPGEFTAGDVLAAADMNGLPGGVLGYAEVTANQTGISTEIDLTGLSVTVDVQASRRVRITGQGRVRKITSDGLMVGRIKESTTVLGTWCNTHGHSDSTTNDGFGQGSAVITPSSGSHTYKLALSTGSGTVNLLANATEPAWILVEDLGPA